MKKVIFAAFTAALLWFIMFSPWTKDHVNFWITMGFSAIVLISMSSFWGENFKRQFSFSIKDILIGVGSAVVLYGVFYIGDILSKLMFDFAAGQVANIYQMKEGENELYLGLLLILLVGPAEEIFWRGFVQRRFTTKYGAVIAFFATTIIYALVHIWSFNFMLIAAAAVCGGFWGLMYAWRKNLTAVVVSHALWDVAVFILFPI